MLKPTIYEAIAAAQMPIPQVEADICYESLPTELKKVITDFYAMLDGGETWFDNNMIFLKVIINNIIYEQRHRRLRVSVILRPLDHLYFQNVLPIIWHFQK